MKRLEIQHLRRAGLGVEEIAGHTQVSSRTVERVTQESPIDDPFATEASARSHMGRPSKVDPYRSKIETWLQSDPSLMTIGILQRLRDDGYTGHKSQERRVRAMPLTKLRLW